MSLKTISIISQRVLVYSAPALFLALFVVVDARAANWDAQKSDQESTRWEAMIEAWDKRFASWDESREQQRAALLGEDGARGRGREYCNERGCWSESLFDLTFTSSDGSSFIEVDKSRSDIDWTTSNGLYAEVRNGGQVINYITADGDVFESGNHGQTLLYENAKESVWESRNFGQVVTFTGGNGEFWESRNYGQSLRERREDGSIHEVSEYDDEDKR